MTAPDVVVVGNGAVGLFTATALARDAGAKVVVAGPSHREGGASSASGAMLGCFGEVTRHTLASEPGRTRFAMQLAAQWRWPQELADLQRYVSAPISVAGDTYVVLNARGGVLDSANFQAMEQALEDHGARSELVSSVPGLDPTPTGRPLRIVHLPDEGAVHSGRLLAALEGRARAHGVEILDAEVARIYTGSAGRGVVLANGVVVGADHVVVAAGSRTTPLLRGLGGAPVQPVLSGSGVAYVAERVMGEGLRSAVRTVTRAGSCGLHALPLGDGQEYFGATNVVFAEPELRPHLGVCLFLAECAIDQIDRAVSYSRIDELRVGNRPVALDTFPLLGPGPVDNVWVLTGGYRDGLHAAPEVAATMASSLVAGRNCFPAAFAPTRPLISTMSVAEAVDDFVAQQVAGAYEAGLQLTPFLDTQPMKHSFRDLGFRVHEQVGADSGLAPDLVSFLAVTRKDPADLELVRSFVAAAGR